MIKRKSNLMFTFGVVIIKPQKQAYVDIHNLESANKFIFEAINTVQMHPNFPSINLIEIFF